MLLLQAACSAGAPAPVNAPERPRAQQKTQADVAKDLSGEHKALVLQAFERIEARCWLDADAEPLLELLAPDVHIVAARGASAGPHDVRADYRSPLQVASGPDSRGTALRGVLISPTSHCNVNHHLRGRTAPVCRSRPSRPGVDGPTVRG